jgi:hypothetical protein
MGQKPIPPQSNQVQPIVLEADKPPAVSDLIGRIGLLLEADRPEKAMELIDRSNVRSSWETNALGVCLLRLGRAQQAVELYRGLVLASGGLVLRADVPTVYKANYAQALLASDNEAGFLSVLASLQGDEHPAARRLAESFERWRRGLPFWQWVRWCLGGHPARPLAPEPPLGEL